MRPKWNSGFTLIEMLIALAIFALLSVISVVGINQMVRSETVLEANATRLNELELAYVYLKNDLEQAIDRPIRDYRNNLLPAFIGEAKSMFANKLFSTMGIRLIEFTRAGQINPLETRPLSHLQRVAYYLKDNTLIRYAWLELDQANSQEPEGRVILTNINEIYAEYVNAQGEINETWSLEGSRSNNQQALPALVDIMILLKDWGELRWAFALPGVSNVAKEPH